MKVNRRRFLRAARRSRSAPSPRARRRRRGRRRRRRGRRARLTSGSRSTAAHQAGVLTEPRDAVVLAALDAIAPDRDAARRRPAGAQRPGARAHAGLAMPVGEADEPPLDSGALGTEIAPDALTVTIGFGALAVHERYGLEAPPKLERMTPFDGDQLDAGAHPRRRAAADQRAQHGHRLARAARAAAADARRARAALVDRRLPGRRSGTATKRSARRNLFGFRDGTANPDTGDDALMRQLVWTPERRHVHGGPADPDAPRVLGPGRPARAGGDDRPPPRHGRAAGRPRRVPGPAPGPRSRRASGSRSTRTSGSQPAHRATDDQRLLRRAWNYQRGFDQAGQLDQGLIFAAFNQDPRAAVRRRSRSASRGSR